MERQWFDHSAAHRRRHDEPPAHGGEDRARVHAADGARARRVARGVDGGVAARRQAAAGFDAKNREEQAALRELHSGQARQAGAAVRRGAGQSPEASSGAPRTLATPALHRRAHARDVPLGAARRVHRLDASSSPPGSSRGASRRSSSIRSTARRRAICTRARPSCCSTHRRREAADGARDLRLLAGARATATTSSCGPTRRAARELARFTCCGSSRPRPRRGPHLSLADFVAPAASGLRRLRRRVRRDGGPRRRRAGARLRAELDDYSAIIVQGARRSSGRGVRRRCCTSARGASGATARARRSTPSELIDEKYRGIRPAFGYPACPDHTREAQAVRAARRGDGGHRADRELRDDAGGERERHLLRASRRRATSTSARSGATRSRTTRRARA